MSINCLFYLIGELIPKDLPPLVKHSCTVLNGKMSKSLNDKIVPFNFPNVYTLLHARAQRINEHRTIDIQKMQVKKRFFREFKD